MRIDLHAHSSRSDGSEGPATLVREAAGAGVDVVALTDHDTFAGWKAAKAEAERVGIGLVRGVEISCQLAGRGVHLLAYFPDPTHQPLADELGRIRQGRGDRVPQIVDLLIRHGMALTLEEVRSCGRNAASIGRPHIADALVARGYVANRTEAFDRWLGEGCPAYVPKYAPTPDHAVALVAAAGGVPVLAHPRGRGSRALVTDATVAWLAGCGLVGLEVDHHDHDEPTRLALRVLAADLDLVVTGASDYHGTGKVGHELGSETTAPEQFERLREAARGNGTVWGTRAIPDGVSRGSGT